MCVCVCVYTQLLSCVQLFATPWTVARQAPLSMGFSRQEYWSRLPFPTWGDLPNLGIEPEFLASPALAGRFFTIIAAWEPLRKQKTQQTECLKCSNVHTPPSGSLAFNTGSCSICKMGQQHHQPHKSVEIACVMCLEPCMVHSEHLLITSVSSWSYPDSSKQLLVLEFPQRALLPSAEVRFPGQCTWSLLCLYFPVLSTVENSKRIQKILSISMTLLIGSFKSSELSEVPCS